MIVVSEILFARSWSSGGLFVVFSLLDRPYSLLSTYDISCYASEAVYNFLAIE